MATSPSKANQNANAVAQNNSTSNTTPNQSATSPGSNSGNKESLNTNSVASVNSSTNTNNNSTSATNTTPSNAPLFHVEKHHTDEEIKERLFSIPDADKIKEEVSGVWGWFKTTTTQAAAKIVEDTQKQAASTSSMFSSFDISSISSTISSLAQEIPINLKETSGGTSTTTTQQPTQQKKVYPLPWEPLDGPNSSAIREKIIALSKDENTFLIPPPATELMANSVPHYNFQSDPDPAIRMLEADPMLGAKRFMLVPRKIEENIFWSNYFYRVYLVKNSFGNSTASTIPSRTAGSATPQPTTIASVGAPAAAAVSSTKAPTTPMAAATSVATVATTATPMDPKSLVSSPDGNQKKWEDSIRTELALESVNDINAAGLNTSDNDNFEMLDDDELLAGVDADDD